MADSAWSKEWWLYVHLVGGLIRPGAKIPVFNAHPIEPHDVVKWPEADQHLIIEEGRRQVDRQFADLERIRARSQTLLTLGLALAAGVVASFEATALAGLMPFILWMIAALSLFCSLLGAAAVMTVRADLGIIDTARLTLPKPPIIGDLSAAYSRVVRTGENTVATRLTAFRDAVVLLLVSTVAFASAWLVALSS
jgi:hypothetical protein